MNLCSQSGEACCQTVPHDCFILQSAVLQRTAAQRDRWRAEIAIDGVPVVSDCVCAHIYVDYHYESCCAQFVYVLFYDGTYT